MDNKCSVSASTYHSTHTKVISPANNQQVLVLFNVEEKPLRRHDRKDVCKSSTYSQDLFEVINVRHTTLLAPEVPFTI